MAYFLCFYAYHFLLKKGLGVRALSFIFVKILSSFT